MSDENNFVKWDVKFKTITGKVINFLYKLCLHCIYHCPNKNYIKISHVLIKHRNKYFWFYIFILVFTLQSAKKCKSPMFSPLT